MLVLKKLAVKDPAGTDIVILSNIMDGVDGAAIFGFQTEQESALIEDMQTLEHSQVGTVDLKVLRASAADIAKLNALIAKRVEIAAISIDGFLLYLENPLLNRVPDFNSAILNDQIMVTTKAIRGYSSAGEQPFYAGRNALSLYNVLSGADDLLYGFVELGSPTGTSLTDGTQTITFNTAAAGNGLLSKKFLCPFVGERLYGSVNVTGKTGTGGRWRLGFRFLQADGVTVVDDDYDDFGATTTRKQHNALIPAGAAYVQLYIANNDTTVETLSFNTPVLSTTPASTFTN